MFEAAATLTAAVHSLSAQTFNDFEIVAVDDGSTDGSGELLHALCVREPRMRVLRQPHLGLVAALNAGLSECRAPFIARMDADDLCHPDRLGAELDLLQARSDLGLVGCLAEAVATDGGPAPDGMVRYVAWSNRLVTAEDIARERFVESPVIHPTVLARREVLAGADGYRDCGWPEDYDLWLRLFATGVRLAKVPRVLLSWRDHASRATRTQDAYREGRLRELKVHHLLAGPLAGGRPVIFWGAGVEGKPLMRMLVAAGRRIPFVVETDLRKVGNVIHGATVIGVTDLPGALRDLPDVLVLAAVAVPSARDEIRAALVTQGLAEGLAFLFVC